MDNRQNMKIGKKTFEASEDQLFLITNGQYKIYDIDYSIQRGNKEHKSYKGIDVDFSKIYKPEVIYRNNNTYFYIQKPKLLEITWHYIEINYTLGNVFSTNRVFGNITNDNSTCFKGQDNNILLQIKLLHKPLKGSFCLHSKIEEKLFITIDACGLVPIHAYVDDNTIEIPYTFPVAGSVSSLGLEFNYLTEEEVIVKAKVEDIPDQKLYVKINIAVIDKKREAFLKLISSGACHLASGEFIGTSAFVSALNELTDNLAMKETIIVYLERSRCFGQITQDFLDKIAKRIDLIFQYSSPKQRYSSVCEELYTQKEMEAELIEEACHHYQEKRFFFVEIPRQDC